MKHKLTLCLILGLSTCQPAFSAHDDLYTIETGLNIKYCGHGKKIISYARFYVSDVQQAFAEGWIPFETKLVDDLKEMVKCEDKKAK